MGNLELKVQREELEDGTLIAIADIEGALDANTVRAFESHMTSLMDQGVRFLILDFTHIGYMNSTGLGILVKIRDKARELNGDAKLVNVSQKISELFEMLGMLSILAVYPTKKEALASLPLPILEPKVSSSQNASNEPVSPPLKTFSDISLKNTSEETSKMFNDDPTTSTQKMQPLEEILNDDQGMDTKKILAPDMEKMFNDDPAIDTKRISSTDVREVKWTETTKEIDCTIQQMLQDTPAVATNKMASQTLLDTDKTPKKISKRKSIPIQETIKIKYFKSITPAKLFSLAITIAPQKMEKKGKLKKSKLTIKPVLKGAISFPSEKEIDITSETKTIEFHIASIVTGRIATKIEVIYKGRVLEQIPLSIFSSSQSKVKWSFFLAAFFPIIALLLDGVTWNIAKNSWNLLPKWLYMLQNMGLPLIGLAFGIFFLCLGYFFYNQDDSKKGVAEKLFLI